MKAVLDACVLIPPVQRDCLLSAALAGFYRPLWSDRILAEWAHAADRRGEPFHEAIAAVAAAFPQARVAPAPGVESRLHLPDEGDIHVLATAIAGGADAIVTWNAADFPRGTLAAEGLSRRDPDAFLWEMWSHDPGGMGAVLQGVRARAEAKSGAPVALPPLLKHARLPRLAKAVAA
jgi:predicted nucleic acid-binding protein